MYDLDGVALSGSLLTSLLNEAASPYAGPEQRLVGLLCVPPYLLDLALFSDMLICLVRNPYK